MSSILVKKGISISSLRALQSYLSLPRWAGTLRQQGEKGVTPKLVVFPPAFIFAVRFTEVDAMVYVRRTQKEQHFSVELLFFLSLLVQDFYVRLKKIFVP